MALGSFVHIAGVLFLHSATEDRLDAGELKTIRWLQCFFGPRFYEYMTVVTSKWDKVIDDELEEACERVDELLDGSLAVILKPEEEGDGGWKGGKVYHHGVIRGDGETIKLSRKKHRRERGERVKNFIHATYGNCANNNAEDTEPVTLQIQTEMGEDGSGRHETQAARALEANPLKSEVVLQGDRAVVIIPGERPPTPPQEEEEEKEPQVVAAALETEGMEKISPPSPPLSSSRSSAEFERVTAPPASPPSPPPSEAETAKPDNNHQLSKGQGPPTQIWPWLEVAKNVAVGFAASLGGPIGGAVAIAVNTVFTFIRAWF